MPFVPVRKYNDPSRYPSGEYQLRHLAKNADENGLAGAFRKVGGRVLVDPDRLQQLIAELPDHAQVPAPRPKAPPPRRRTQHRARA